MVVAQQAEEIASLDAITEQIEADRREAADTANRQYRQTVERLADGDAVSKDDLRKAIDGAGKSTAQLKADVEMKKRRRELVVTMEKATANAARRIEIGQRQQEIRKEIARLTAGLHAESQKLGNEFQLMSQTDVLAATAEDELRRTISPELKAQLSAAEREIRELANKIAPMQNDIESRQQFANGILTELSSPFCNLTDLRKHEATVNVKAAQDRIREINKALQPLRTRLEELRVKEVELREAALQP